MGWPALGCFAPSVASDPRVQRWWARLLRASAAPAGARALLEHRRTVDVRHVLDAIRAPMPTPSRATAAGW